VPLLLLLLVALLWRLGPSRQLRSLQCSESDELAMNAEQIFGLFTKCVEGEFFEVRIDRVLRSLHNAPVLAARIPATHTYDSRGGSSLLLTIIYGVLVISGICLLSLGGLEVVERLVPAERRQPHNDVAGFIYAALGVIYAVLLALVVIAVFEEFQAANETVEQEANAVAEIFWLGNRLPEPEGTHIQELGRSYAEEVFNKEWPLIEQGQAPLLTQTRGTPTG
jgi:hypothetical protein